MKRKFSVISAKQIRQIEELAIKMRLPGPGTAESMTEISLTIAFTKSGDLCFMNGRVDLRICEPPFRTALQRRRVFCESKPIKKWMWDYWWA
jgi:hypothetical protein